MNKLFYIWIYVVTNIKRSIHSAVGRTLCNSKWIFGRDNRSMICHYNSIQFKFIGKSIAFGHLHVWQRHTIQKKKTKQNKTKQIALQIYTNITLWETEIISRVFLRISKASSTYFDNSNNNKVYSVKSRGSSLRQQQQDGLIEQFSLLL